jgi:hypothetical protein
MVTHGGSMPGLPPTGPAPSRDCREADAGDLNAYGRNTVIQANEPEGYDRFTIV